jgi:hypothetical protein
MDLRHAFLWLLPTYESRDNAHVAESVEPERGANAERCGHDAAERRPQRTTHIDSDAVRANGRRDFRFGFELSHDRLPGRGRDGRHDGDNEREYQQAHRRYEMQPN